MSAALRAKLEALLRDRVLRLRAVHGGDINQSFHVELAQAGRLFVKTHEAPPPGMYGCEAQGLGWLAQAGALRLPRVIAHSEADQHGPACLVLELIEPGPRRADFDEVLGHGLAALHRSGAASFGLDHDNYIALLPQANTRDSRWPRFYATQRLLPQLRLAVERGHASAALRRGVERVCARIDTLTGHAEPPARLHGDLWGGNLIVDEAGEPCLIDPAVYAGHREVDLAMMQLFGGFEPRVFEAYNEVFPLAAGHEERTALYQLYPLLVHVNLFGGHYVSSAERLLARID
ncbi:MAG TPA: fructosamine kinase family protein [Polyangiales bacterium]